MRTDSYKMACVFGGTGFIGRQIVRRLADEGYTVKVASRVPERAYFLKTSGNVGQIVPFFYAAGDEASIRAAVRGCDVVVNCVGTLHEKGKASFARVHTEFPRAVAKACTAENVRRFIHLSALSCDKAGSKYGKSKRAGEQAVAEGFPAATILRPSVVFGTEDNFFNMFARLATLLPALPLVGGGQTKFQPVYVGDIADAVLHAVRMPASAGETYELGGPDTLTLRAIYERLFAETGRPRMLVTLPWGIAKLQSCFMAVLPNPPLTPDQVETLKTDNVVGADAKTLKQLDIVPTSMDVVLPTYLARFKPGGRFGDKKRA